MQIAAVAEPRTPEAVVTTKVPLGLGQNLDQTMNVSNYSLPFGVFLSIRASDQRVPTLKWDLL
jgi:hypothetical protein